MSDTSGAFAPPPPPSSAPPPAYGAPPTYAPPPPVQLPAGYKLPDGYQGPTAPDYSQLYQGYPQPYGQQQGINPGAVAYGGASVLLSQFGGAALASIICGLVSIIVPFVTNFYFPILPVVGLLNGVRAIQKGRLIGGLVGLALSALGGLVSLFASGLIGG